MKDAVTVYASVLRGELEGTESHRATQKMLEMVMDSIPQAIFWKDLNSVYLGCNRVFADLAGLEPGELIGQTDHDMPWANHGQHFQDWDRHVMDTGQSEYGILETIVRRDGTALSIETNKIPLLDFDGQIVGVLGTFEDVTNKLHVEEELRQSLEELDERVRLRTEELSRANDILRREVDERVRLQAEERQQRAYAEAMRETAAAIAGSLDLDEILEEVLVGAERLLSHDLGAVILFTDADGEVDLVHHRARFGYGPAEADLADALDMTVIEKLHTENSGPVLLAVGPGQASNGLWADARAMVVAPMAIGGQLVGVLSVESATAGLFDVGHVERLGTVAAQAAAAISNARLFQRTAEMAAIDERQRLARDLHDSVSQTLWTAALLAGALAEQNFDDDLVTEQVESIKVLTRGAVAEMRTLLLELRPLALEEAPLHELLDHLIAGLVGRKEVAVSVDLEPVDPLPTDVKLAVYRIAQEAFNNISRHAYASKVTGGLVRDSRRLTMAITDDGRGFQHQDARQTRLGISIMHERAADIGATLNITSTEGVGTTVQVVVPLPGERP